MSFPHYWSDWHDFSVKEEQDDSATFIMEPHALSSSSQSQAPPTEVPLRATQAPPEMRSMMGVFRLNPFAMHSGEGRGTVAPTWCGEEAHPLDQEPIIFEFQLDLDDDPKESLRSFSPDFELHHEPDSDELDLPDQNDWPESYHSESVYCDSTSTWDLDYPPTTDDNFSPSDPTPIHFQPRQSSRLYEISQQYLQKNAEHADYTAALYPASVASSMASVINPHRMPRPPDLSWSRAAYVPASRSTMYASDSPACHSAILPSITSSNRRWSLPDSNSTYHLPFFG